MKFVVLHCSLRFSKHYRLLHDNRSPGLKISVREPSDKMMTLSVGQLCIVMSNGCPDHFKFSLASEISMNKTLCGALTRWLYKSYKYAHY
jgi:hypothetical protein